MASLNINSQDIPVSQFKLEEDPASEVLTRENPGRFVIFPIQYPDIDAMYQKAKASFWTEEEIDLGEDLVHWRNLNDGEREFLQFVIAFFAASDGIVNENLVDNFGTEVQLPEARAFYTFQMAIETIHSRVYSLLIDTYVSDTTTKHNLFNAIDTIPAVQTKALWAMKWTRATHASFAERLIAFAAVEGIFFSASFCAIFWMKKRGLMPGLSQANELISRDEGLHFEFACLLYSMLDNKLPKWRVQEIIVEAVDCERDFVQNSLRVDLIGMNADMMTQYVEYVADVVLKELGNDKVYNVTNPFDWMDMLILGGRANFFERRPTNYARPGVAVDAEADRFCEDEDF